MRWKEYLSSRAVTLCFLGIGALAVGSVLAFAEADIRVIVLTELFLLLWTAAWLTVCYLTDRRRLEKLERLVQELPEKYLLGEVLPPPENLVERQYYDIMKTISGSAIGIAEQSVREKEEYCDYVESWIHEIKTPLTACSLILSNDGDIRKLRHELKRADNLTETILYYARMRTPEKDTRITKLQAAGIMEEAVKSQMEILIAAKISVETEGDFTVYSDAKALCFILKQLLINCAKYCPGCHVSLRASDRWLIVEDNGIGIPSYEIRRVTERGFTGTNGRRLGGSTGMGLYIVKELCRQLGIGLRVESEQGSYTRITLSFG